VTGSRLASKARWLVPAAIAAAALWALADPDTGLRAWQRMRAELASASAHIEKLRSENEALRREADALRDDPVAIEGAIRQGLELARPGELVVKLPPAKPPTEP
jgi:hypothetical protein